MDEIGAGGGGTLATVEMDAATKNKITFFKSGGIIQCSFELSTVSSSNDVWTDALGYEIRTTEFRPIVETTITQCLPLAKDSYGTFIWRITTDGHIYYKYFNNSSKFYPTGGREINLIWLVW